jgi:hypothetical protein
LSSTALQIEEIDAERAVRLSLVEQQYGSMVLHFFRQKEQGARRLESCNVDACFIAAMPAAYAA